MARFLILMLMLAQTHIEVKPGARALTLEGEVQKGQEVSFVFHAQAGLKFQGHLTGKAGFSVDDPDGKGLPEEEFDYNTDLTGSLAKTGDYKISIATFESHAVHFTLRVQVY
jgi:hypothetical protein